MLFSTRKKIVTHSGSFHADDVFACAVLAYYHEQKGKRYRIIRTRDEDTINRADIVVDVGTIYNPEAQRYDHHQQGGAGKRDNGIPYASFGLVWKHYGPLLCSTEDHVEDIDRRLVQPIDAIDNGISISESIECGLYDYGIHGIIAAYQTTWKDASNSALQDRNFNELVSFCKNIIKREVKRSDDRSELLEIIQNAYDRSEEKQIIEIPYHVGVGPLMQVLGEHPEVQYIVAKSGNNWKALALRKEACSFESRTSFPEQWAGKRSDELQEITGVPDAQFCHNALFLCIAHSKEGAQKLAEIALQK
jgi:uncharacterized UPF0160 family protein